MVAVPWAGCTAALMLRLPLAVEIGHPWQLKARQKLVSLPGQGARHHFLVREEHWGLCHRHHQCGYPHLHPGKPSLALPALQLLPRMSGSPFHSPCNLVSEPDWNVLASCLLLTAACCQFPHISENFCRIRTACWKRRGKSFIIHIPQRRIMGKFVPGPMPYSARETCLQLIYFLGGDGLRQWLSIPKLLFLC